MFSKIRVHNPASDTSYRVVIRSIDAADNSCTCLNCATNPLGTREQIELKLARLAKRRGGKAALAGDHTPDHGEIRLDHAGERRGRFHLGSACWTVVGAKSFCSAHGCCSSCTASSRWLAQWVMRRWAANQQALHRQRLAKALPPWLR